MSKLDELIQEYCPEGIEYKLLPDVLKIQRGVRVVKRDLMENGLYPVYQNSLTPLGYYDKYNCEAGTTMIIVAGAAGDILYSSKRFWAADDCFYFVCNEESLISKFLYYALMVQQRKIYSKVRTASIPRLSRINIEKIRIPIPPLPVQREIVRILDNFTELTAELTTELTTELTARKKQYEYYKEYLFENHISDVECKRLDELFPYIRNGFVGTIKSFFTNEIDGIRYLEGTNIHDGVISDNKVLYVTKEFHEKHAKNQLKADDILMVQSGHIGECAVVGKKYEGANCHALIIMSNGGKCLSKYYMYYFHTLKGFKSLTPAITGGTIKHVLAGKVGKIKVPVPPLEVQKRIVDILDRFDALCNDISSELPAEIEARQKQYEYYRDKLLNFKELKKEA